MLQRDARRRPPPRRRRTSGASLADRGDAVTRDDLLFVVPDRPRHVRRRRREVQPGRTATWNRPSGRRCCAACPAGSWSSTRAPAAFRSSSASRARAASSSPRPTRSRSASTRCSRSTSSRRSPTTRPTSTRTGASRSGRRSPPRRRRAPPLPAARPARDRTRAARRQRRRRRPRSRGAGRGRRRWRAAPTWTRAAPARAPTDEVLLKLLQRRASLGSEVEELKIAEGVPAGRRVREEFERIMIELAKVVDATSGSGKR